MKKYFFMILLIGCCLPAIARHIAGGELFYNYTEPDPNNPNNRRYRITQRLFRSCNSGGPRLEMEQVNVGIYEGSVLVNTLFLPINGPISTIALDTAGFPCLVGNGGACYEIAVYSAIISLPINIAGYTLSRLGCCRVDNITNITANGVGSNYVTKIPGTLTLPVGTNSSPQFFVKDTALICSQKKFKIDFGASDIDTDSLTYSFCDAYTSPGNGGSGGPNGGIPPSSVLRLDPVPYRLPFTGSQPLGPDVTIDPATGIISGIAPAVGAYVVSVCITEWRNGVPFTEHRKDFIMEVQNCDFIESDLPDKIIQCKDFTVLFENQSSSSAITGYVWNFGDSLVNTYPQSGSVKHTYKNAGTYKATLTVTGPKGCIGYDSTEVLVYPGFKPAFNIAGSCVLNPYQFMDATTSVYGTVNSWKWNFGDETTLSDTSLLKSATYKYPTTSTKSVLLTVGDTRGCRDTLRKTLVVSNKPFLQLPFKDTLICNIDTLPIIINNPGNYSWEPNTNILFPNTSSPLVFPKDTTKYIVTVNDNGCIGKDTLTVNVLPFITVDAGLNKIICQTDTTNLFAKSDALQYRWTSSTNEVVNAIKNPFVRPLVTTTYYVLANLGKCQDRDSVIVQPIPYPIANAGNDTIICEAARVQLNGQIVGSSFFWRPINAMLNANTLRPIVSPSNTTLYTLTVSDTLGCQKAVTDSVTIIVVPPILLNAGNDTAISNQQALQLNATGAETYQWTPSTGLNDAFIANPIATLADAVDSITYRVRGYNGGTCFAEDEIKVRVFKTGPDLFVPSAFTPNGDGKNDVLRPIPIGISNLQYFRVYNRWGQLLFTTSEIGRSWDGSYGGVKQASGTYIFVAEGKDFTGKRIFRKGTAVLIR